MPTQRYKLTIAYRGTAYHGWQFQTASRTYKKPLPEGSNEIPTVQGTLAAALVEVVRHPVQLVGSSRTDAGVHAKGQVAHFDTDQLQIPPEGLRMAVNSRLPGDIVVKAIQGVDDGFDAIASTVSKRYQYLVWSHPDRNAFQADTAFHRWQTLDLAAMRQAAARLVGRHDFASFAKPGHGRENTVRTVFDCDVSRRGAMVVIGVHGSGFLWNMVRIIAGTLIEVGIGRYTADDVSAMLAARDRQSAGQTAPAHGLYLQWIRFKLGTGRLLDSTAESGSNSDDAFDDAG